VGVPGHGQEAVRVLGIHQEFPGPGGDVAGSRQEPHQELGAPGGGHPPGLLHKRRDLGDPEDQVPEHGSDGQPLLPPPLGLPDGGAEPLLKRPVSWKVREGGNGPGNAVHLPLPGVGGHPELTVAGP